MKLLIMQISPVFFYPLSLVKIFSSAPCSQAHSAKMTQHLNKDLFIMKVLVLTSCCMATHGEVALMMDHTEVTEVLT
jgi:hypothetical protein